MGSITDRFSDLCDFLQASRQKRSLSADLRTTDSKLFVEYVLRPWLPQCIRYSGGTVFDSNDRVTGPFDLILSSDSFPTVGGGSAVQVPVEGVIAVLQIRNWSTVDVSTFAKASAGLKSLAPGPEDRSPLAAAVTFDTLPMAELNDFMNGPEGGAVDAGLALGQYFLVRNTRGFYGDPARIPVVTQRGAGPSLKAFSFLIYSLVAASLKTPFQLTDYQHL